MSANQNGQLATHHLITLFHSFENLCTSFELLNWFLAQDIQILFYHNIDCVSELADCFHGFKSFITKARTMYQAVPRHLRGRDKGTAQDLEDRHLVSEVGLACLLLRGTWRPCMCLWESGGNVNVFGRRCLRRLLRWILGFVGKALGNWSVGGTFRSHCVIQ